MMSPSEQGQEGGRRSSAGPWLAVIISASAVVALTILFALEPWSQSSSPDSSADAQGDTTLERAEFPSDLCDYISGDLVESLFPKSAEAEPRTLTSLLGKRVDCDVEPRSGSEGVRSLAVNVERTYDADNPSEHAQTLFGNSCDGLDDGGTSYDVSVRPISKTNSVGEDVCGQVEVESDPSDVTVRLFAVDGPDTIQVIYSIETENADKAEQDALAFTQKLIEKLRG